MWLWIAVWLTKVRADGGVITCGALPAKFMEQIYNPQRKTMGLIWCGRSRSTKQEKQPWHPDLYSDLISSTYMYPVTGNWSVPGHGNWSVPGHRQLVRPTGPGFSTKFES
jgi:hypothetical protein